ncbi:lytic transglycosylase domain-containing protein [Marinactinospora rubrisoli]|uniref:Lytic transglycosylase domain-containing protein n=1 Tax=Marinactinospora rubrisoli TaxID=2715399 RepID=A0ABW2KJ32_9ACTN
MTTPSRTPDPGSPPRLEEPPDRAAPSVRRSALVAAAAVLTSLGVTAGILGAVSGVTRSAAPTAPPPGSREAGGQVDTLPGGPGAHAEPTGTEDGARSTGEGPDDRPFPGPGDPAARISPEWLDRVAEAAGIPSRALQGYAAAQLRLVEEEPDCQVSWPTLAAIGHIESWHGGYAGGEIGADGRTTVDVIGIPLDGTNGTAAIPDTDEGRLDGDPEWDRAVGPMQFIPATWARWGADGDGDGRADPHDIDDAALTAGRYLCADGRVLTDAADWQAAVLSYNRSDAYAADVLAAANGYAAAAG